MPNNHQDHAPIAAARSTEGHASRLLAASVLIINLVIIAIGIQSLLYSHARTLDKVRESTTNLAFLIEQNIAATLALATRVYILNNGHIVHEGPAAELKKQPELLQRYLSV